MRCIILGLVGLLLHNAAAAQGKTYPVGYFRHPMAIPMELVANFGELRNNHWHMGLDIRTQQRQNLPVYAAAAGYVSKIKIEAGGFGRAIYIAHPNGYTTLYAHLNAFAPAIEDWLKAEQYRRRSWGGEFVLPRNRIPLQKGEFFAYSGNTGASAGPHVHFEVRDTETDNCLNPLLFGFPIADAVPPTPIRLAMYDRRRSTYAQSPALLPLKKTALGYALTASGGIRTGSPRLSFALSAIDRFSGSANPNGIYAARLYLDSALLSGFVLDDIDYSDTRYFNAHTDYQLKAAGGAWVQHLAPLPGDPTTVYNPTPGDGIIELTDTSKHTVRIDVDDANGNRSSIRIWVQWNPALQTSVAHAGDEAWWPNHVNVFESPGFEAWSSEISVYDTLVPRLSETRLNTGPTVYNFGSHSLPLHDSVTFRIRGTVSPRNRVVMECASGTRKWVQRVVWQGDWAVARFRNFGAFRLIPDSTPPTIAPPPTNLTKASRLTFVPKDNLGDIRSFEAYVDGQWIRCSNNGGKVWIYTFDEYFSPGAHTLKVVVEDEAGNVTERSWEVVR